MKIPLKSVEVELSDGQTYLVHTPRMKDLTVYMRAVPALMAMSKAFEQASKSDEGITGIPVHYPSEEELAGMSPLFSIMMEDMTPDEFQELGMFDGMAIMKAMEMFVPKNWKTEKDSTAVLPT